MAILTQQPNTHNSAYVPNVYIVSGAATGERYVLTVNAGGVPIATYKQTLNPAGVGTFDIQRVLQSYLEGAFVEGTERLSNTPGALLTYNVSYSIENADGTPIGQPQEAPTKYVINAYGNWREINADLTNFIPSPVAITCENNNVNAVATRVYDFLTNYPEPYTVRSNEYKTLSFFNRIGNFNSGPDWGPNEAPFWVVYTFYDASGAVLPIQGLYPISTFNGLAVRQNCQDLTVTYPSDAELIGTVGVGPANLADNGLELPDTVASYAINIHTYNNCLNTTIQDCNDFGEILGDGYVGDVIYTATFNIDKECEKFEPITLSFINQYGVKDYYTFNKRNTRQINTQRNNYTKVLGTWNAATYTISETDRGDTVYSSTSKTQMTLSTDWMSDSVSEWMQELYASPSVNIYVDGFWEPVMINTQTYEQKTYARNQLFQHEITVEYANNQKIQRG